MCPQCFDQLCCGMGCNNNNELPAVNTEAQDKKQFEIGGNWGDFETSEPPKDKTLTSRVIALLL